MALIPVAGTPAKCTDELKPVAGTSVKMAVNIHLAFPINFTNLLSYHSPDYCSFPGKFTALYFSQLSKLGPSWCWKGALEEPP